MSLPANLEGFKAFMEAENFQTEIQKFEEEGVRQLLVNFGEERILQVRFFNEEADEKYPPLQLVLALPFVAKAEVAGDLSRLILLINEAIDYPGFSYHESNGVVFYRNVHLCQGNKIEKTLLETLLGALISCIDTFGEMIEEVGTGKKSLEEALKEAANL